MRYAYRPVLKVAKEVTFHPYDKTYDLGNAAARALVLMKDAEHATAEDGLKRSVFIELVVEETYEDIKNRDQSSGQLTLFPEEPDGSRSQDKASAASGLGTRRVAAERTDD
jgi:hypothetical protein